MYFKDTKIDTRPRPVGDGKTDDTAAIQAIHDESAAARLRAKYNHQRAAETGLATSGPVHILNVVFDDGLATSGPVHIVDAVFDEFWDRTDGGLTARECLAAYEQELRHRDGVEAQGPTLLPTQRQLAQKAWHRRLAELKAASKDRVRYQVRVTPEVDPWE